MARQPARDYTRLAVAIVVAAIVIGAGIAATSYLGTATTITRTTTFTSTSTELCAQQIGNATGVYIINCQLGVTLSLGIENQTTPAGSNETFYVSLHNELASDSSLPQDNPILPPRIGLSPSNLGPATDILPLKPQCGQTAWIAVYNASGLPVQLNDVTPVPVVCGQTSGGLPPIQFTPYQTLAQGISVGGSWHSSNATAPWEDATYHQFPPGHYTVIAFGRWTQPIMLNFTVS